MNLDDFYSRHEKVALMFSGGKDSIACLHLLEEYLDRTTVIWINTQANFPEINDLMDGVKQLVPRFLEVVTDQPASIKANGYPTDVLPINFTAFGQSCTSIKSIKLRSYVECCNENLWQPAQEMLKDLKFTGVIRGQRLEEDHKSSVPSGYIEDGIEYIFPINDWSEQQVYEYLTEKGVPLDDRLKMTHSSLDCWNCTAYLNSSQERMEYVKVKHPEKFKQVIGIIKEIDTAITEELAGHRAILEV